MRLLAKLGCLLLGHEWGMPMQWPVFDEDGHWMASCSRQVCPRCGLERKWGPGLRE